MMICNADFDELFPHLFQPESVAAEMAKTPRSECIARWEDDGGLPMASAAQRRAPFDREAKSMAGLRAIAALMPAVKANHAASKVMLSPFGQMQALAPRLA